MILSKPFSAWLAVVLYAALIFAVSAMSFPFPYIRDVEKYHYDWIFHIIEYVVFGWLVARAFDVSFPFQSLWALGLTAFTLGSGYGVTDEWHQSFVPYRNPSVADWIADSAGSAVGVFFYIKRIKLKHA